MQLRNTNELHTASAASPITLITLSPELDFRCLLEKVFVIEGF